MSEEARLGDTWRRKSKGAVVTGCRSQPARGEGPASWPTPPPSCHPRVRSNRSLDPEALQMVFLLRNSWAWGLGELPELEEIGIIP